MKLAIPFMHAIDVNHHLIADLHTTRRYFALISTHDLDTSCQAP